MRNYETPAMIETCDHWRERITLPNYPTNAPLLHHPYYQWLITNDTGHSVRNLRAYLSLFGMVGVDTFNVGDVGLVEVHDWFAYRKYRLGEDQTQWLINKE